jgi:Caspase domain
MRQTLTCTVADMRNGAIIVACRLVALVLLMLPLLADRANAQDRIALVIGNDRYPDFLADRQLAKAVNDARAVGDALEKLGFVVIRGENLDRHEMADRISEFAGKINPGDMAFFFYAGHGVAISGSNYLLPSDVRRLLPGEQANVRDMAIGETDVVAAIQERQAGAVVIMLDACHENPLMRSGLDRGVGQAIGLTRGAEMPGALAIYSAGSAHAALDRLGPDDPSPTSLFVRELAPRLARSDADLVETIIGVRESVAERAATAGVEQFPAYYDQIRGGRVFLANHPTIARPAAPTGPLRPSLTHTVRIAPSATPGSNGTNWGLIVGGTNLDTKPKQTIGGEPSIDTKGVKTVRIVQPPTAGPLAQLAPPAQFSQKVVLYEESAGDPVGKQFIGSVVWRSEPDTPTADQSPSLAVLADIEIPARGLTAHWRMRRNTDQALPASHTIEISFTQADSPHGEIIRVPGVLMKQAADAKGMPLASLAVKVTSGVFLIGLSAISTDMQRNIPLLKERPWLDIPIVYADGKRAILAIEKGEAGAKAMTDAFAQWETTAETKGGD